MSRYERPPGGVGRLPGDGAAGDGWITFAMVMIGLAGAVFEMLPLRLDDNLTIPLCVGFAGWVACVSASFLSGYLEAIDGSDLLPRDGEARRVSLDAHLLEKACYEIQYELDHRPDWVWIPLRGIAKLFVTR